MKEIICKIQQGLEKVQQGKLRKYLDTCTKFTCYCKINKSKLLDHGFGNRSYLMVHILTLATCWFDFDTKTTPLPFLNVFTIEDGLSVQ